MRGIRCPIVLLAREETSRVQGVLGSCDVQEHALYLWDKETTDKNLEAAGLSPKGMKLGHTSGVLLNLGFPQVL